jgi:hypothetical protein
MIEASEDNGGISLPSDFPTVSLGGNSASTKQNRKRSIVLFNEYLFGLTKSEDMFSKLDESLLTPKLLQGFAHYLINTAEKNYLREQQRRN